MLQPQTSTAPFVDSIAVRESVTYTSETKHRLNHLWNLYFHLPADKDKTWTLESYREIMFNIGTVEEMISLTRGMQENIVKYGLLFLMRKGIAPFWEDVKNRDKGAFSFKVTNRLVCDVWRNLCFAITGETFCVSPDHLRHVNGISISPKKGFCCVKVWMDTLEFQSPDIFIDLPGLSKTGCLFRLHDT